MTSRLDQKSRRVRVIFYLAGKKFLQIEGATWAGAFAFSTEDIANGDNNLDYVRSLFLVRCQSVVYEQVKIYPISL